MRALSLSLFLPPHTLLHSLLFANSLQPHGLQHSRLPCPSLSLGGALGEAPPNKSRRLTPPFPARGQLGCILRPTEPPWVDPSWGPCESLPQALEASVEGASLCSKASFVLLLALLHNPFLPSGLQMQVLRVWGALTVSSTEVADGQWSGIAEGWHLPSSVPCSQSSGSLTTPDIWGNPHLLHR